MDDWQPFSGLEPWQSAVTSTQPERPAIKGIKGLADQDLSDLLSSKQLSNTIVITKLVFGLNFLLILDGTKI